MTEITAGSPRLLRTINARAVLDVLDRDGPIGRPELVSGTGLSKTAISQTLADLQLTGAVEHAGMDDSRRGPAARLFRIAPRQALGVAVDIGHRRVRVAIVGLDRHPLAVAMADADHTSVAGLVAVVDRLLHATASTAGVDLAGLESAVIGVPAVPGPGGPLRLASGLADEGNGLPAALAALFACRITLENDTNLAAIAEQAVGAARGTDTFVLLSIGDSVGAGIVLGGRLHRGHLGAAGEIAYLPGQGDRVDDTLGAGSIATDAAGAGMTGDLSAPAVFAAARAGDPRAVLAVEATAKRVARVAAALALVLDPELIVLGGPIGSNADLLISPVQRIIGRDFPHAAIRLVGSAAGADAVLDGASELSRRLLRELAFDRAAARG